MPDAIIQSDLATIRQSATIPGKQNPLGYAQYTSTGSAFLLSAAPATGIARPAAAQFAMIQANAQAVRWRDDGTAPTATTGLLIPAGGELDYNGDLTKLQLIAASAGAIVDVSYYG